jgi:hypothetical protein
MRFFLRRTGFALVTGLVIFCCSCERHQVAEIPAEPEKARGETHTPAAPEASPTPGIRATPANFFPDKPKP